MAELRGLQFKYTHQLTPEQREQVVDGEFEVMKQESMAGHAHAMRDPQGLKKMVRDAHFESEGQGVYAVQKGNVLGYALFGSFPWHRKDVTIPQVKEGYKKLMLDKPKVRQGFVSEFLRYLFSPDTGMQVFDPRVEQQIHEQLQEHLPELGLDAHTPTHLFSSYMDHPLIITNFATYNQRQGIGTKILDRARADARQMGFSHIALQDTSEASVGLTKKRDKKEVKEAEKTPHRQRSTWNHLPSRGYPFITSLSYQQAMPKADYEKAQSEEQNFFYRMIKGLYDKRKSLPPSFVFTALPILVSKYHYLYSGRQIPPVNLDPNEVKSFIQRNNPSKNTKGPKGKLP